MGGGCGGGQVLTVSSMINGCNVLLSGLEGFVWCWGAGPALMLGFLGGLWGLWGWGATHLTLLSFVAGTAWLWMLLGGWKIFSIVMQTLPR